MPFRSRFFAYCVAGLLSVFPGFSAFADTTFVDTTAKKPGRLSIIPVPVVGYTPETRWVGGFVTAVIARIHSARPSTIVEMATYSQNDQFRLFLNPDVYFGPWHTVAEFEMRRWPDSYWGIGNHTSTRDLENYTARDLRASVSVQKKLGKALGAGLHYALESFTLLRVEHGRTLEQAGLKGRREVISGPGFSVFYDTRDNTFSPERGAYLFGKTGVSAKSMGASRNYRSLNLDLRGFIPVHGSHVVALQGFAGFTAGDPPFTVLPNIGNEYRLRGYPWGRFRDRNVLTTQIEYRFPLLWSIRGAVFAGAGDVADRRSHFARADFKHSLGGGLRWVILPKDKACIRLDKAWGQHSNAFYVSLNEAF